MLRPRAGAEAACGHAPILAGLGLVLYQLQLALRRRRNLLMQRLDVLGSSKRGPGQELNVEIGPRRLQ